VEALLPGPGGGTAALREATAHLAKAIREGRYDEGEARASLLAHLRRTVRERLAVSNPRALSRDERTPT